MAKNDGKICAILSYILIGIIWFFADNKMRKNALAKYHAKQALNLLIIEIVFMVVWSIFTGIVTAITFGYGLIVLIPISSLIWLAFFVLWLFGIIYAIKEQQKPIPVIGGFADKYLKF